MFKKVGYFVCIVGLFFSAAVYASSAKITSNDGTPIKEFAFSGGAFWFNGPSSYPVTHVTEDNVTAIIPFSGNIKSGDIFDYTYDITTAGKGASIWVWFDQNVTTTGNGIEVGMAIDDTGALEETLCEADPRVPLALIVCVVTAHNGVATMNVVLQGK